MDIRDVCLDVLLLLSHGMDGFIHLAGWVGDELQAGEGCQEQAEREPHCGAGLPFVLEAPDGGACSLRLAGERPARGDCQQAAAPALSFVAKQSSTSSVLPECEEAITSVCGPRAQAGKP